MYNGATYVAFSHVENAADGTKLMVKNSASAPSGGTAGNMCMQVIDGLCEAVCRVRDGTYYWVLTNGTQVNRSAL